MSIVISVGNEVVINNLRKLKLSNDSVFFSFDAKENKIVIKANNAKIITL